jgi:hypothetical protein
MRLHHSIFFILTASLLPAAQASDVSWIFRPAYYTHSPVTGQRVAQYAAEQPSIVPVDPTYQESGYRHQLIQVGTEWLNLVQTWGAGTAIRPYGEWEYPYRPGATPYGPWYNPQGPWMRPSGSWQNPYDPNRPPYLNGPNRQPYGYQPYGYGPEVIGYGAPGVGAWQPAPQSMPYYDGTPAPALPEPMVPRGQAL